MFSVVTLGGMNVINKREILQRFKELANLYYTKFGGVEIVLTDVGFIAEYDYDILKYLDKHLRD